MTAPPLQPYPTQTIQSPVVAGVVVMDVEVVVSVVVAGLVRVPRFALSRKRMQRA